jgi:hypothetical protein
MKIIKYYLTEITINILAYIAVGIIKLIELYNKIFR